MTTRQYMLRLNKGMVYFPFFLLVSWGNKYRLLHGKCARTVFTHELLAYQKTNEWVFWYKNECVNTVQSTFHAVICLYYTNWNFSILTRFRPSLGKQISSYVFIPSVCKHVASSNPNANIFRNVYLAAPAFDLFPLPCSFTSFASSFQTFPCL